MDKLFSIIIPHYCIPDLLCRCLGSIPCRDDVEVLVIDDCSPRFDETLPSVKNKFPGLDMKFLSTGVHTNAGRARNIGLDNASGKWLFFADADDFFTDSFNGALDRFKDASEDIIYFKARSVISDDVSVKAHRNRRNNYKIDSYLKTGDEDTLRFLHGTVWPLMIRRKMVVDNSIRFHETEFSNDIFFACCCGIYAKTIGVDVEAVYVVTERRDSLHAKIYQEGSDYEARVRLQELIEVSKYVYAHTGRLNDILFSRLFLTWLYHPEVANEMLDIISKEFSLTKAYIMARSVKAVCKKALSVAVYNHENE